MGTPIDREALHRFLYRRVDRMGRLIRLNQTELAEELGVGYCNLSVILNQFIDEGRLQKIGGHRTGRKSFVVANPAEWSKSG